MKPRYLHIGSFNIEHFGREDKKTENQFAIAEHIELSGVQVLALQELYVTNDIDENSVLENSFLRDALDLVEEHTGNRWDYLIFRNNFWMDKEQLCGIAWNTDRVRRQGDPLRIEVKNRLQHQGKSYSLWDRHPHAVKFQVIPGEDEDLQLTDFVMISVHMKSNVGSQYEVKIKRGLEAAQLVEQIPAIINHFGDDEDIVIIGDTNCKNSEEPAIKTLVSAGFEDLNSDDISTYYKGNSAPFDRIFVPRERPPFDFSRQYIMRSASPLEHDMYLSDHFIIKASIIVRQDDD